MLLPVSTDTAHPMLSVGTTYDTPFSSFERMTRDLVIIRFKENVVVDYVGLNTTVTAARAQFKGDVPYAAIVIFPANVDFNMNALEKDHYAGVDLDELMHVMAVVARDTLFRQIADLYFAYFPVDIHTKVFDHLQDAIIWVDERIAERDGPTKVGRSA